MKGPGVWPCFLVLPPFNSVPFRACKPPLSNRANSLLRMWSEASEPTSCKIGLSKVQNSPITGAFWPPQRLCFSPSFLSETGHVDLMNPSHSCYQGVFGHPTSPLVRSNRGSRFGLQGGTIHSSRWIGEELIDPECATGI